MQNDEWIHYLVVNKFMQGDFTLHPYLGSTFYVQGLLAALWSYFFTFQTIPILTLGVSCLTIILFACTLYKRSKLIFVDIILISLLLFFNPLFFYSSFGFMSENYFLLFLAIIFYFYPFPSIPIKLNTQFLLMCIAVVLGFFTKQYMLFVFVGIAAHLLMATVKPQSDVQNKRNFIALIALLLLICLAFIFEFVFPKTLAMQNRSLNISGIFNFRTLLVICLSIAAYIGILLSAQIKTLLNFKNLLISSLIFLVIYLIVYKKVLFVDCLTFPFLLNTFSRNGFFPNEISGGKYSFRFVFKIFEYWQLASVIVVALTLPYFKKIRLLGGYIFPIASYVIFLLMVEPLYDRYLLPLIYMLLVAVTVTFVTKFSFIGRIILLIFIIFQAYLSTVFLLDSHYGLNYISNKLQQLQSQSIARSDIKANRALNIYDGVTGATKYAFTYDKSTENAEIVEVYENSFFMSPFIQPYIYLIKYKE